MTAFVAGLSPRRWRAATQVEIEGPMAIVILVGLIPSTDLKLLMLPTLSLRSQIPEGGAGKLV